MSIITIDDTANHLRRAALLGDVSAIYALSDLTQDAELIMRHGDPVFVIGPLDFAIGIVDIVDGAFIRLQPGCVTTRNLPDQTALLATGKPSGCQYAVHPLGHNVAIASTTGYSLLPKFDTKDWPSGGRK